MNQEFTDHERWLIEQLIIYGNYEYENFESYCRKIIRNEVDSDKEFDVFFNKLNKFLK